MNKELFKYLVEKADPHFLEAETEPTIKSIEKRFKVKLPEDYKNVISNCRSMQFFGEENDLLCISRKDIIYLNTDDFYSVHLKGLFIFGKDGGGNMYAYDPNNILGKGNYAVFWASRSDLTKETLRYIGNSLTEVVTAILNAETKAFFEWKRLEQERQ